MSQKEQIARTFERQVVERGFAKANLDEVARELHISKKTIYVHFEGKSDIYRYVVEEQAGREQARLRGHIAGLPTARDRARALVELVIRTSREHIEHTAPDEWLQEYEVAADAFATALGNLMREVIEEGIEGGEFPPGDAAFAQRMVGAMLLDYTRAVNADHAYDHDEELTARIMRFIG